MNASKLFIGLFSVLISISAFAQESRMSDKMLLPQAPVPNMQNKKDLMLYADRPSDILIVDQKKSLRAVSTQEQLLPNSEIIKAFRSQLGRQLDEEEAALTLNQGFRVYANFIDGIKNKKAFDKVELTDQAEMWQMVMLNATQVEQSILHLEWFSSGIGGHAQLRFKLDKPLLLISQDEPRRVKWIEGDIVYTLQVIRTVGGGSGWGIVTGLTGALANAYIVASSAHMASIQTNLNNGSYIEQYQLKLSQEQNQELLANVLQVGSEAQEKEVYNLIYNSCIQAVMRALKAVDARVDAWEFNPYQVLDSLKKVDIIEKQLASVNEEFKSPVQSLMNSQNAKSLYMVNKIRASMSSAAFSESLRTMADVIIEDRWSSAELSALIEVVAQLDLKTASLGDIQAAIAKAQFENKLPAKTTPSIQKLIMELAKVLQRNQLELKDLMAIFATIRA